MLLWVEESEPALVTHLLNILDGNSHDRGEKEMSLADVWPDAAEHSWNILRLYSKKHHV
jgi:hypothetical protein